MANPAAYLPLQDQPITLQIGGDLDHTFGFDLADAETTLESVLSYVADPVVNDGQDVSIQVLLNGTNVLTHRFDTSPARAMQEILPKDLLKAKGNKLKVSVTDTDGNGAITFDDIVLLYSLKT